MNKLLLITTCIVVLSVEMAKVSSPIQNNPEKNLTQFQKLVIYWMKQLTTIQNKTLMVMMKIQRKNCETNADCNRANMICEKAICKCKWLHDWSESKIGCIGSDEMFLSKNNSKNNTLLNSTEIMNMDESNVQNSMTINNALWTSYDGYENSTTSKDEPFSTSFIISFIAFIFIVLIIYMLILLNVI